MNDKWLQKARECFGAHAPIIAPNIIRSTAYILATVDEAARAECKRIAEAIATHAQARIKNDDSMLDYRQKIRWETASRIAWSVGRTMNDNKQKGEC